MTFFHAPLINAYQNLSNVMLRIQPRGWQSAVNDTLLLNAHYDSPIGSTGKFATHCGSCSWAISHPHFWRLLDWMEHGNKPHTSAPARVVGAVKLVALQIPISLQAIDAANLNLCQIPCNEISMCRSAALGACRAFLKLVKHQSSQNRKKNYLHGGLHLC